MGRVENEVFMTWDHEPNGIVGGAFQTIHSPEDEEDADSLFQRYIAKTTLDAECLLMDNGKAIKSGAVAKPTKVKPV
jgi:hypothetical protein